ncbi:helix-turn-helix transcriptional regulator [Streptomyces sp. NBC_00401]|uniref:helix-turn-helix transcriptional regulator n=1 Tax=Streptomyces sp. NBC_00401 TaxID=2975738 RepID=UPI0022566195|nr:helix-turn-helix transcriptional regulator [Streptomyces sp. NBC_00401]MCX5085679.1 helix-turn-helix transcriptional regulator [Streptomyces sp. NBC_00401]
MSDTAHTPPKHTVSPELGPLLKRWRKRIDHRRITGIDSTRRRLKPGLTQDEVASLTGVASSWYRQLEGGSPRPISEQFVQRLAMTLRLEEAERVILFQLALGHAPPPPRTAPDPASYANLQSVLDALLPHPAYVSNLWWDIVAHNKPQEDWFPWLPYEPNLMRFAFLYPEARDQLVNWRSDWAIPFLAQIRFAIATHPDVPELLQLRDDILDGNEEARELWADRLAQAHPDGDVRGFSLPFHGGQEIQVRIMAFAPMSHPELRMIALVRQ